MKLVKTLPLLPLFALTGCYQVLGLGDYTEGKGGSGATAGTGAGLATSSSTSSSTTGAGGQSGCEPGVVSTCYEGKPGTVDVGTCVSGTHICLQDHLSYTGCMGQVVPQIEDCAQKGDENCDGMSCSESVWVKTFGDPSGQAATNVAVDPDGNVYFAGQFSGVLTIGNTMLLGNHGATDIFIAKLAPDGTPLWAKAFGSIAVDYVHGIDANASGLVVFGGSSSGQHVDLGTQPSGPLFIAKFSPAGDLTWGRDLAVAGSYIPNPPGAVVLDSTGNILVGANVAGTIDCGGGLLPGSNAGDIVLAKFNPSGQHIWSHRYFGTSQSKVTGVDVDFADDVLITGSISSNTDFHGSALPASDRDPILVKVKHDGTSILWKKAFGGVGDSTANGIAVDASGGATIIGTVGGALTLGQGATLNSVGGGMFIAKFGNSGAYGWSKQQGNAVGPERITGVTVEATGAATVTGDITGNVAIGPNVFNPTSTSGFLAKFDAGGNPRWSRLLATGGSSSGAAVDHNAKQQLLVVGSFTGSSVDFGLGPVVGMGGADAFVLEVDP